MLGLSPYIKEELLSALRSLVGSNGIALLLTDTIDQYPPMHLEWEEPMGHVVADGLLTWKSVVNWEDGGMYICNDGTVEIVHYYSGVAKYLAITDMAGSAIFIQPLVKPIDLSVEASPIIFPDGSIKIYL